METVRYRPGEAIRWLQTGAANIRKVAQAKGRQAVNSQPTDVKTFGQGIATAASALVDLGKGAYAELIHRQAEASEYVLQDDRFDIVTGSSIKTIEYDRVKSIKFVNEKMTLELDKGSVHIKPFAHLVAGRVRVPVGWSRNGMEVPYDLIVEEIAARCQLEIEED